VLEHQQLHFVLHHPLPHGRQFGIPKHIVNFTEVLTHQALKQRFDLKAERKEQSIYDQSDDNGQETGHCEGDEKQLVNTSSGEIEE
jgi:hypothetical protein